MTRAKYLHIKLHAIVLVVGGVVIAVFLVVLYVVRQSRQDGSLC